jgi:hypothetical protein
MTTTTQTRHRHKHTRPLGARIPHNQAQEIKRTVKRWAEPELVRQVITAVSNKKEALITRKLDAGEIVLDWMHDHGEFVQSETGGLYYLDARARRLLDLNSDMFGAWLYARTGLNPGGTDFAHILADCKSTALRTPARQVVRVAHWDTEEMELRVSRFDGTVYVIDGHTISEEANGVHVIFDDDPGWQTYTPDFDNPRDSLLWSTEKLPCWEDDTERSGLAYRAWVLSSFFSEICPSRPLAVFLGEKGSGKSMALRVLLRLMFGAKAEISGIPDKPDGFTAAAAAAHIFVLDNLDKYTGWLRDKLARICTGAEDHYRKLYTSNERGRVVYRCWLAITARTPGTLRRDDLADRLLLLKVIRISDEKRKRETAVYDEIQKRRDAWWGDVLHALNAAITHIRQDGLPNTSRLRLADWEALGRVLATCEGKEDIWDALVADIAASQDEFLLEDDIIVSALDEWLSDDPVNNPGRELSARELYNELTEILYPPPPQGGTPKRRDPDWAKNARSFGMRLRSIRDALKTRYGVHYRKETSGRNKGAWLYTFTVKL